MVHFCEIFVQYGDYVVLTGGPTTVIKMQVNTIVNIGFPNWTTEDPRLGRWKLIQDTKIVALKACTAPCWLNSKKAREENNCIRFVKRTHGVAWLFPANKLTAQARHS